MTTKQCFICLELHIECLGNGDGRNLQKKALDSLKKASLKRKDSLDKSIDGLPSDPDVWVKNSCYKKYTDERKSFGNEMCNANKPVSVGSSESTRSKRSYGYRTHCLICEEELDFVKAKKHPNVPANKISSISWIDTDTSECRLHETLKAFVAGKTDPISLEVAGKLEYADCLRAEEAKYHRYCLQRFLNGKFEKESKVNRRNLHEDKNDLFDRFCDWYENTSHESTALTLFDVQFRMEQLADNGEVYTIKQINRKLIAKYGNTLRFTSCNGRPSIMLLKEEADQIVLENVLEPSVVDDEDLKDFVSVGRQIAQTLQNDSEREEFYPYANDLTLEKLRCLVPTNLACPLDATFPKSRTSSAQEKKDLRKAAVAHIIMQWCKKEGYQSPLLLAVALFVHQITRSQVLVDVLCALGFSLSYMAILEFEKCAAVSTVDFTDIISEDDSMERFLQFIADNFAHNEDTTTGAGTIHVMGLISSEFPKFDGLSTQPIMRQKITSGQMIDKANLRNLIKFYEKPNVSKFKKTLVKSYDSSQLDTSLYDLLDTFWLVSSSFLEKPPNWQGFMANIIHGNPLKSQIRFLPIIPLDPSSYEAVYSTMHFIKEEIKKKSICCTSLTFHQPFYWKAKEIKADKSPEFDSIHLKLGGFHQLMSFLGAGCKLMEDGGLKELWSTVYQENSIPKMMASKAYSRCLRAVLLTDSALHVTLLSSKVFQIMKSSFLSLPIRSMRVETYLIVTYLTR